MSKLTKTAFKLLDLLVVFMMTFGSPMAALAQVWTDQPDYSPGSVVTINGDNSDGAGYLPGEIVHVDVAGPNGYTLACDGVADDLGAWSCQVTLASDPAIAVGAYTYTATGLTSGFAETGMFTDAGGSYSLNWSAADPKINNAPYTPTYGKVPPTAKACPTPSGSSGRASDPMQHAVFGNPKDSVESLAPPDMALGQIVPFEVKIAVSGSTAPESGVIQFTPYWLAKTTSGGDFGYDPAYEIYCAFVDYGDTASVDPLGNAKVDSWTDTVVNVGTSNEQIQGTLQVSGLDSGDSVIVEIWVVLKNTIPAGVSGNVQTGLVSAKTATGDTINTGNQTVPLLRVQEFFSSRADLSITKSDSPDPVIQGQQLTYSLTVTNLSSTIVANGVVVSDTLDPNTTFVSGIWPTGTCSAAGSVVTCNVGALSPLASVTITVTTTVSATAPINNTPGTDPIGGTCTVGTGFDLCNMVSVSSVTTDPNTANNNDSEPTNVLSSFVPAPHLLITKSASPASYDAVGQVIIYKIVATNDGNTTLAAVTVSDPSISGLTCTPDNGSPLAPGAYMTCAATHTIVQADIEAGLYTNTACVDDGVGGAAQACASVDVPGTRNPAISIVKTTNGSDGPTILVGQPVTWSYLVTNTGNVALSSVSVADDQDVEVTCPSDTLAVGTSMICTASGIAVAGNYSNIGTASGTYGTTTVTATDPSSYFGANPAIDIQKTPDMQTVVYGQTATFTIVVTNTGNVPLSNVTVTDPLAPNCAKTIGDLAIGGSTTYTCSLANVTSGFTNIAYTSGYYGTTEVTDNDNAVVVVDILPDIAVTKTASPTSVPENGGNVEFTFVVTNNSSEPFILNSLTDDKFGILDGQGTCDVPQTIPAGGTYTCKVTKFLSSDTLTPHTNVVTASGTDEQGNPDSATDDETVTFTDVAPAIRITKTASPTSVPETGGNVTFTFLVENIGNEDVTLTTLSDNKFGDLDGKGTCVVPQTILIGGSYSCTYTVFLSSDSLTAHTNVVTATAVDDDGTTATDDDDETVTFTDVAPVIRITKTASPTSVPETGGDVTFTFLVENIGVEDVTLTTLSDTVFSNLDGKGTCDVPQTILIGGSYSCTYTVFLSSDSLTAHYNVATATAVDDDNTPATDDDDATVTFTDVKPTVTLDKSVNVEFMDEPGGDFTFTLLITNTSPETVTITSLTDTQSADAVDFSACAALVGTTLAAGASTSCEYVVTHTDVSPDGAYENTASVTVKDNEGNPASASDSQMVWVDDLRPTVTLEKLVDKTTLPEPGGVFNFTLKVTNTSVEPIVIRQFTDWNLPAAFLHPYLGTWLQPGEVLTINYPVTHTDAMSYRNDASVTVQDNEENYATDTATQTVYVTDVLPTVTLVKSVDVSTMAEPGGVFNFTLTITNTSPETVWITALTDTNTPILSDDCLWLLSDNAPYTDYGVIPAGGTVSCTYTVTHTEAGSYPNTASVTVADNEGNEASASDDETVTVTNVNPTVTLTKSALPTTLPEPGGVFTFTLTVTNNSVEKVEITALSDDNALSAECTALIGTFLDPGKSASCTYTVTHTDAGSYPNTASVTVADNEGNPASDTDDETVTVTDVLPTVDLTKSVDSNGTFNVGDTSTFTLTIKNTSAEAVTITTLTDTNALSPECQALIGISIPAGGTVSCTYTVIHNTAGTYPNTASVTVKDNENNPVSDTDTETITVYTPTISKTANGTYDEVHTWTLNKTVDPATQAGFAGEEKDFTWTITVGESEEDKNFEVSGVITVVNPNPDDPMTVTLSDKLNDGSVAAIGPCTGGTLVDDQLTIPAGGTATCDYSATPTGRYNLNALAAALPNQVTMSVQYPYEGAPAYFNTIVTNGGALNGSYEGWCVDTDHIIYQNTPYTANVFSSYESLPAGLVEFPQNFDLVNWIINQDFVDKSAAPLAGNYTYGDVQRAIWELIDDTVSTSGLGTWSQAHVNQIKALAQANGEGFMPTCGDMVAVVLQPVGGTVQTITIAQVTFASLGVNCADTNVVTAVLNGIPFNASKLITWEAHPIDPTATLTDEQGSLNELLTGSEAFTIPDSYTCPVDPNAYTDGILTHQESNTATLSTVTEPAAASTEVKCYAPVVSKTAAGAYDERHEWDVEKSVTPLSQNAFAGDTVSYEWTVVVTEDVTEETFKVVGEITVINPAPMEMTVDLTDALGGGTVGVIGACTNSTYAAGKLTIPANTTATCAYVAEPTGRTDTVNNVTATLNGIDFDASATFGWTANVIRGSATLDDDQNPAFPLEITNGSTWNYTEQYTCSTNKTLYEGDNTYTFDESNTATLTSGDFSGSSTASTVVNCYWPQIELTKTGDVLSKIGDDVTYTIKLFNNTPTDASLRDLSCTITDTKIDFSKDVTLASGASDTSTQTFTIPTTASDPFLNTASVTCSPLNSTFSVSDEASWSTNLFQPKVEIIKTGPANVQSGVPFKYTFTINNLSSSDAPKLEFGTDGHVQDNVLGDLTDAAKAAGCDNLGFEGNCTFDVIWTHTLADPITPVNITNVVDVLYHPAGFPNNIMDTDDHTVTVVPGSQLTDTSFCPLADNQFRLLYRLEAAPNIYRLGASNPGQFYFNGFYFGEPGEPFTMTLQVPYPFMTQEGAGNPIQVHDGTTLTSAGCYSPNPSLSGFTILTQAMTPTSSAGNQIITTEDYTTKQLGQVTTVTVSGVVPDTGFAYVTIHLDYGLKKTSGWKNPGTATLNPVTNTSILDMQNLAGFNSGAVTIHGYEVYNFARTVGGDTAATTPSSYNEIKKFAGFLGIVTDKDTGEPLAGVTVKIYSPTNTLLATLTTDEDGYYFFEYKHKAKSATYKVVASYGSWSQTVSITIKANGFAANDFEVP